MWGSLWGAEGKLRGFPSRGFCSLCEGEGASPPERGVGREIADVRAGKFVLASAVIH